jgi:hypothetical protein
MVFIAFGSTSSIELETVSIKAGKYDVWAKTNYFIAICQIKSYLLVMSIAQRKDLENKRNVIKIQIEIW